MKIVLVLAGLVLAVFLADRVLGGRVGAGGSTTARRIPG
jgi:hypothetical protein